MDLKRMLKPKAIAVVGATEKKASFGYFCTVNALQNKSNVRVYLVNQRGAMVCGVQSYTSLDELPEVPDTIMIATPKKAVAAVLEQAGRMGVAGAVVVAAGYAEDGTAQGKADQEELRRISEKYGIIVMGPNCTGFVNNVDKVKLWGMGGTEFDMETRRTGCAIFAQSGTIGIDAISCPFIDASYVFSMGNSMLTIEDILELVVEEDEVKLIGIYLEGPKDAPKFLKGLARANELGKPVVILAAGLSEKGAKSCASHTGNLASSRGVYEALFSKYGVIMVDTVDEFISVTNLLSHWHGRLPKKNGFGGLNTSGGYNTISADLCEKYGVNEPDIQNETVDELRTLLSDIATPKNPLDATAATQGDDGEEEAKFYFAMAKDPNIHALVFSTPAFVAPDEKWAAISDLFGESMQERQAKPIIKYASDSSSLPCVVIPQMEDRRDSYWRKKLSEVGVPILAGGETGYKALGKVCRYIEYLSGVSGRTLAHATHEKKHSAPIKTLTEYESKAKLAEYGIPVPKQCIVTSVEQLRSEIESYAYPVVMKISSPDIMHKTEAGGVKLNIMSVEQAENAYADIMANCRAYAPNATLEGILLQEMAPSGVEMIIGINNDPMFGPMLVVGMGGVFVEVFKDAAMYPCPLCKEEAVNMLKSLKAFKLLGGYRGSEPCDIDALADVMVKVASFAAENKETIKEMDMNPVVVYPEGRGVAVLDALVVEYTD